MRIAIITETDPVETRVAASAETVKKLVALGATIAVQSGAGTQSGMTDDDFVRRTGCVSVGWDNLPGPVGEGRLEGVGSQGRRGAESGLQFRHDRGGQVVGMHA